MEKEIMALTSRGIKYFCVVLAVLCAIAFMPVVNGQAQSNAAAKLGVSATSASITAGDSISVKATGLKSSKLKKVTWKSSKTSVATVSKKKGKAVTIKAKKAGKATITAKSGKQKVTIKVTVKAVKTKTVTKEVQVPVNSSKQVKGGYVMDNDISVTGYAQGDATVYALLYQESAEVAALQMQAFNLAKLRIDEQAADKGGYDKLAIVTDIDSTIADDTCYIAGAVLDASGRLGVEYFGEMLQPWVNDDWCGYYQAVATTADTVIPGAKEFVDYTYEKGVEWYYITNRPYYELDLTVQQLFNQGFLEKAPDADADGTPDLVEDYAVLRDDPDGSGDYKTYQDYLYYKDENLASFDADGWANVYNDGQYAKILNDTGNVEMTPQSFSVKDDYRVQVQGTDFDSDKGWRRANAREAAADDGREVVMYLGDSINDMVSDYESKYPELWGATDRWNGNGQDFTRKQFNNTRTANASKDYWKDHWGNDFIVLPNATYGDWYKTTWAKGKDPDKKYNEKTAEGQQNYIYDQIWDHSYLNTDKFTTWYDGPSPVTNDVQ